MVKKAKTTKKISVDANTAPPKKTVKKTASPKKTSSDGTKEKSTSEKKKSESQKIPDNTMVKSLSGAKIRETGKQAGETSGPGKKYTCHNCGIKFYDLHKPEKICPKCGANQSIKTTKTKTTKTSEYDVLEEENENTDFKVEEEDDFIIEDEEEL